MRVLLVLLLAMLCGGCLFAASRRLEHPATGEVRYCWQVMAVDLYGGWIYGDQEVDAACLAALERQGYIQKANPLPPGLDRDR